MRILSDFHDYYDAVQATGQDQTLIYSRKREEVEVAEYPFPVYRDSLWAGDPRVQQHVVGFCGTIYPVLTLTADTGKQATICFNVDEVDHFVERNFGKKAAQEYWAKTPPMSQRRRWRSCESLRDSFAKYFAECALKKDTFGEVFRETLPSVHCHPGSTDVEIAAGKIAYNACLKDLEFFRLFDTYTAFQEISMFLGGLAVPLKEIPEVPDKIMVGVKGFDQWSFRKPPQEKK